MEKEQQEQHGGGKDKSSAVNPLQKKPEDRSPYEKMEMATKQIKPVGEEQEDKNKQWHVPTKDGHTKPDKD